MTIEQFITGYLLVINVMTFLAYGLDKAQAQARRFRTPEKFLLLLAFLGGSPAALFAMNTFRHKTKKLAFQLPLMFIIALQSAIAYATYYFLI